VESEKIRAVKPRSQFVEWPGLCAVLLAAGWAVAAAGAQSAGAPGGRVTAGAANGQVVELSLDDAVRRGLETSQLLHQVASAEKALRGERNLALQAFLPTITLTADTGFYQHNLAAMGFNPRLMQKFASLLPGGKLPAGFSSLTHDTLTEGLIHYDQTLFSGPAIAGWKAAGAAERSAHFATMDTRDQTVEDMATLYLRAVADGSAVDNAKADVARAQLLLNDAHEAHMAGTVANLEELRAKVELEAEEQALIAAENARDKDLIELNWYSGLDLGQKITLTDAAPYSELAERTLEELLATAYRSRQDYQSLRNQAAEFKAIHAAYRSQRWPVLRFGGYYGTQTVSTVGTHGVMMAAGTLSVPLFREAELRGGEDASRAQLDAVNAQLDSLRQQIEEQVRAALLDVSANRQLVEVARSNVELATRALDDETARVKAGVDTNLPLVSAQASLTAAQANLVESQFRLNVSKLGLARSLGVLETQYREYLGR